MLEVCDIVEYGLNSFKTAPERWRVTGHYKRVEDDLDSWEPTDVGSKITKEILLEYREEDRVERKKNDRPHTRRYKFHHCIPSEATHAGLTSIGGDIAPINECKKIGVVQWNAEIIEQTKKEAVSEFWLKNDFPAHWYWE